MRRQPVQRATPSGVGAPCCAVSRGSAGDASTTKPVTVARAAEGGHAHGGMIRLPGGKFLMGTNDREGFPEDGEGPVREVALSPFYIDAAAVSNAEFARFVAATGYRTEAERFGWSFVFYQFVSEAQAKHVSQAVSGAAWWWRVEGASWRQPDGPDSTVEERLDHPVVHVTWNDAVEFCNWALKRLPTEAEWEYAARGGLQQMKFPWGDELLPDGRHRCNIWQGEFPKRNTMEDGYAGTAPVNSYPPNGYGLFNMSGNVWEWCSDWFSSRHQTAEPRVDPAGPPSGTTRTIKGGSYLCHRSYCNRYRVAARTSVTPDSSTGHTGFRCVTDA